MRDASDLDWRTEECRGGVRQDGADVAEELRGPSFQRGGGPQRVRTRRANDLDGAGCAKPGPCAAPSPVHVENQIAAITGRDPQRLPEGEWFKRAKGTIQRRDGGSVEVDCYMHPDPVVEAWRRHKHVAPIIQMLGRARPYNRTAETPLVLDVLVNEPLGIAVDEVLDWVQDELEPMALIEPMACDRFVALAPEVLCALWPKVLGSERTAKRELEELRGNGKAAERVRTILKGWRRFTFQKSGKGQKRREGYYDLGRFERVEGLRSALERVLGPGLRLKED